MDNMNLNKHISGQFNAELESVRNQVLVMGGLVEKQLTDAIAAIHGQDLDAARKIVANDHKVNAMEVAIDEECTRIIAKRQPTASDLRLVMAIIKTITDLERIGDVADKIARMLTDNARSQARPAVPSRAPPVLLRRGAGRRIHAGLPWPVRPPHGRADLHLSRGTARGALRDFADGALRVRHQPLGRRCAVCRSVDRRPAGSPRIHLRG